ncbi:unnamed protein product [Caenorhabditis angaria]|uniref:RING-type domain-containing protein n=1 Tax=Caenorhabditis angaria TaxID=860376 RepID=A0A9P1MZQ4_9PELO|nr:unnamed protein product [Caenorhabditis angaria]
MQSDYHREHNVDPNEEPRPRYTIYEMLSMSAEQIEGLRQNEIIGIFEALGLPSGNQKNSSMKEFEKFKKHDCGEILDEQAQCTICLDVVARPHEDQSDAELARVIVKTPCNHYYHYKCAKMWYEQSKSCPHCRTEIKSDRELEDEIRQANLDELHDSMFS